MRRAAAGGSSSYLLGALLGAALALVPARTIAQTGATGALAGVRVGVTTQPDTVTVGDPLVIRVRVAAPAGATIAFPAGPDSGAAVAAVASRAVTTNETPGLLDQTATYRVVAWDIGNVPAGLGDVVVTSAGETRRLPLSAVVVHVKTVLPADTTLRLPKLARPPIDVLVPWWKKWWPLLVALAVIALLIWLWWRRRKGSPPAGAIIDPHAFAEREFGRIESLGLVDAGERGRHVALMVDVLRDYLALRLPEARASLTSSELSAALRSAGSVPHTRLAALLDETDLVKFARRPLTPERARALGKDARGIARDVEAAFTANAAETTAQQAAA